MNIPTEVIRTAVTIAETGSLSKTGERLGLSQPAISSQIKRLERLMGCSLFERTPTGTLATDLGKLALQHAKRMLEANDQLLRLSGSPHSSQPLRLGLGTLFAEDFFNAQSAGTLADVFVQAGNSSVIAKGLIDGYIDIGCIFESRGIESEISQMVVSSASEPLVWIRARQFVTSPGSPIPIITWTGDDWMVQTLERNNIWYKIVLNGPDFQAKLAAVEAGLGLSAVPASRVPSTVVVAKDYYLPQLPAIKAVLCVRPSFYSARGSEFIKQLSSLFFENRSGRVPES